MLLFKHACAFFSRFLLSRNYKIQIVARVGRKSVVVLSGAMEASYPHFFIGRDFDCSRQSSRIHFPPLRSKGGKSILEKWSRESGKEKGPGQLKRMLRIYPTYYGDQLTRLYSRKKVRKIGKVGIRQWSSTEKVEQRVL